MLASEGSYFLLEVSGVVAEGGERERREFEEEENRMKQALCLVRNQATLVTHKVCGDKETTCL